MTHRPLLVLLTALSFTACSKDPRSMGYAEWDALIPAERKESWKELSEEEREAIIVTRMKYAPTADSTKLQAMSLQEIIEINPAESISSQ